MKILVLSNFYPPHYFGGYELQCSVHVDALRERGHDIQVLTSRYQAQGVEGHVHRLLHHFHPADDSRNYPAWLPHPFNRMYHHAHRAINARRNYRIAQRMAVQFQPDLVFIWNLGAVEATPALAITHLGIPIAYDIGDYWLAKLRQQIGTSVSLPKRLYRIYYRGISSFSQLDTRHILIVSENMRQHYISVGFPPDSLKVLPRGVDPTEIISSEQLSPTCHERGDKWLRVVFVGRLDEDKGIHVAIEALRLLKDAPWRVTLDIIGDGDPAYVAQLQQQVAAGDLTDRVTFLGRHPREDVLARYPEYDVAVIPSVWVEPFGNIVLEAMAHGTPSIASAHGGLAEVIADGVDGLLFPPGDAAALAAALCRLTDEPALLNQMRQRGLEKIQQRYNAESIISQMETYLLDLATHAQQPERKQ